MKLSEEDIVAINKECPSEQGIFAEQGVYRQPYGIPIHVKEPVIYMRWETGGVTGGSCWGTKHYAKEGEPKPQFRVLDLVLKRLKPDISFLQFRDIEALIKTNDYTDDSSYYGNSTDYAVEYIVLSELIALLEKL
jgi:hypothetical protein